MNNLVVERKILCMPFYALLNLLIIVLFQKAKSVVTAGITSGLAAKNNARAQNDNDHTKSSSGKRRVKLVERMQNQPMSFFA